VLWDVEKQRVEKRSSKILVDGWEKCLEDSLLSSRKSKKFGRQLEVMGSCSVRGEGKEGGLAWGEGKIPN